MQGEGGGCEGVSQANHDLDFGFAEGSHQVAITPLYLFL
jgi:hypothetical protein